MTEPTANSQIPPLRIGIIAGMSEASGGGWTFVSTISRAITAAKTRDTFVWLDTEFEDFTHDALEGLRNDSGRKQKAMTHEAVRLSKYRSFFPNRFKTDRSLSDQTEPAEESMNDQKLKTEVMMSLARKHTLDLVWFLQPRGLPLGMPYIATVWDLEHRKQPYFPEVSTSGWTWDERETEYQSVLPRATFVITGTDTGKREIEHFYRVCPDRVRVVPFPVPDADHVGEPDPAVVATCKSAEQFIFYPAQYWPHKNHVNLLLAMRILADKGRKLGLVLTGADKGNKSFVMDQIRELKLSAQVYDLGFVSRGSLSFLFEHAEMLVFPSFFGPDNLPPLEAFAAGCPVVAAGIRGALDQLKDGALYFDPSSPEDIAQKVGFVCDDIELRQRLIKAGAQIAAGHPAARYFQMIHSLLDEFRRSRRCWGADYRHT